MHSKEPWKLGRDGAVVCEEGKSVNLIGGASDVEYYGGHLICESICKEDARRVVACVNACRGIETETLELSAFLNERELARLRTAVEIEVRANAIGEAIDKLQAIIPDLKRLAEDK